MAVRYPSLARRKQVSKARDKAMAEAVAASVGFVQETHPQVQLPPREFVRDASGVEMYDLDKFRRPGSSSAAVGPFIIACSWCGFRSEEIDGYDDAEPVRNSHYRFHYERGEA